VARLEGAPGLARDALYGFKERRFLKLARAVKSGTFVMFGRGDVRYHFVHVEDLSSSPTTTQSR
jgi:hypothetical protein